MSFQEDLDMLSKSNFGQQFIIFSSFSQSQIMPDSSKKQFQLPSESFTQEAQDFIIESDNQIKERIDEKWKKIKKVKEEKKKEQNKL